MKRFLGVVLIVLAAAAIAGCGKNQEAEEMQPITMDSLSNTAAVVPAAATADAKLQASAVPAAVSKELGALPPQGPYKPTAQEIQTALKNAGYYTGSVDGKLGPKSKKAVEEFQKANGLKADGKVGPKTWEALSKHLNAPAELPKR